MTQEDKDRYTRALHAMQTGVAVMMNYGGEETDPKHLRVGVNSAMVESSTLTRFLVEKGFITWDEYWQKLADVMEEEVKSYTEMVREATGVDVINLA